MRRIISILCIMLNLGLTGPAIAHTGGPVLSLPLTTQFGISTTVAQTSLSCRTEVFHAGAHPANPLTVDSITCLDASCDTREVVLCPLTD